MADTIKVPGIKEPLPKWGVFAGLGGVGVLIAVHYRNQKNSAAASQAAAAADTTGLASGGVLSGDTSSAYPWDGTYSNPSDPYSLDTTTGQTYGNSGYYGGFGVQGSASGGQMAGPPFASNTAWSAYAIQQLTSTQSTDPASVTEALGLYLEGKALTTAQQDIVYSAIAVAGPVPVQGPGGYPPKLRTQPSQGNGHKGGTAFAVNPVKGLRAVVKGTGSLPGQKHGSQRFNVEVTWDKSAHATGYQVSAVNVTGHRTALAPVTTVHESYLIRGLRPGDTFRITVLARPAEKGAKAAETQVRT